MAISKIIFNNVTQMDVTGTTALVSDVAQNKIFTLADGTLGVGSNSGSSATQHSIHFDFSDNTDTDILIEYDDSLISTLITAYEPANYGGKTVVLAQLDGVTWYDPTSIPSGVELVDYSTLVNGYVINGGNGQEASNTYAFCTDFLRIDPSMTFSFIGYQWFQLAFYDSTKTYISGGTQNNYSPVSISNDYVQGVLSPTNIPATASYVRLTSYPVSNPSSSNISLIRTA